MCSKQMVQQKLRLCVGFLEKFTEIIDCHMVEFFTDNLMSKVPQEFLLKTAELNKENFTDFKNDFHHMEFTLDSFPEVEEVNIQLEHGDIFTDNMNPKKIHEVAIMAKFIAENMDKSKEQIIIDAGGGIGYLSSWLAFNFNFKVLGLDSSESNSKSAHKRSERMSKKVKLFKTKEENYKTKTAFIDETTDFNSLAIQSFPDSIDPMYVLTGLHTCGSLSNNCLRIFRNVPSIKKLFNVGCCYNLLNENDFPMSDFLKNQHKFCLSRNARMLAAYSVDRTFESKDTSNLDKIFYRALFEKLLTEAISPPIFLKNIGPVKCNSFLEYVEKVKKKFKDHFPENVDLSEEKIQWFLECNSSEWNELLKFHLFRMSFAPVIESTIILDKVLFLLEDPTLTDVRIVRLFDPVTSPRCYLVTANK